MQIRVSTVFVADQDKALACYTGKFGIRKMADIALGPYRWLTVVSPEGVHGVPVAMGAIKAVMFEDGCGNVIHLVQPLVQPEDGNVNRS